MSLTPKRCLQKMADALQNMEAAQRRFSAISAGYAGSQETRKLDDIAAGNDPELRSAITDTGYYANQAQTWALAATALLAGLDRYGNRSSLRDCHAPVKDAHLHDTFPVGRQVTA